jgi:tetratricopeptide (TPR) repeat protein
MIQAESGSEADAPNKELTSEEEQQQEIAEISRKGYQLLKENYTSEAIDCFRQILSLNPDNNYALVGIGDAYRKKRRYNEATQYYQKCLDFFPSNNYALFGLADCFRSMKHFHRAIEVWEEYLKLDDKNVTVLTRVADAYRKVRNLDRSVQIYNQVLGMEPDNPYALIGLGHLYYDFKNFEKALHFWLRMYEKKQGRVDIRVLTSLGNCHRKLKTYKEGIPFFEQALEHDPKNFYALFGLADCHRGLNEQEHSLKYWNKILEQDPANKVILTRAGDAYRKMDNDDEAEGYYRRALNIEYDTYAILGLAMINKHRRHFKEASESLETLLREDGKIFRIYPELMDCYVELKDKQSAKELMKRFEKVRNIQPTIQMQMDHMRQQLGV